MANNTYVQAVTRIILADESYQIFPVSTGVTIAAFPAATHAAFAAARVQEKL